ncbi:MAG: helix-turn-helix transcriptional regulator [Magnetococcales bacterium]|nr:helix-turn-helix transcriptional regulator [Magnetococcales bacterium]
MDSDNWVERLRLLMQEAGWKHEQLANVLGITRGAVGHYFTGSRMPNLKLLHKISRTFSVTLDWLVTGEGQRSLELFREHSGETPAKSTIDDLFTLVPRHAVTASLGHGQEVDSEQIIDFLAFKTDWLLQRRLNTEKLALISSAGDSMQPTISDGDMLLIDLRDNLQQAKSGKIYLIRQNDHLYAKRIHWMISGDLIIKSDNKEYTPETIIQQNLEQVHVIGRVVWIGKDV